MNPLALPLLDTRTDDFEARFARLRHWSAEEDAAIEQRVAAILADVRARGDAAVLEYTARFDGVKANAVAALEISREALRAAFEAIPVAQREALAGAAARVASTAGKAACCWPFTLATWPRWPRRPARFDHRLLKSGRRFSTNAPNASRAAGPCSMGPNSLDSATITCCT